MCRESSAGRKGTAGGTIMRENSSGLGALLIIGYLYGQSQAVDLFWRKHYYPLASGIRTRSDSIMKPPFVRVAVLFVD